MGEVGNAIAAIATNRVQPVPWVFVVSTHSVLSQNRRSSGREVGKEVRQPYRNGLLRGLIF